MKERAKRVRVSWMAGALLPLVAGVTSAANVNPTGPQTYQPNRQEQPMATVPGQTGQFQPQIEKAKNLIGAKIVNDRGEQIGVVADVVLTPNRDAVNYVVLSTGWAWGMSSKYFAVPWSQIQLQPGERGSVVVLNGVSRAQLNQAQGFDKKHWPAAIGENWLETQRQAPRYPGRATAESTKPWPERAENPGVTAANGDQGLFTAPASGEYANPDGVMTTEPPSGAPGEVATEPGRGSSPNTGRFENVPSRTTLAYAVLTGVDQVRLSKLLGAPVWTPQGQNLGTLNDAMIDVQRGRVAFGIVGLRTGFLGLDKKYAPVPWPALDLTSQPGVARLDTTRQTLLAMASDRDNFPNLENPQYSRQLYERFNEMPYWETLGYVPSQNMQEGDTSSSGMTAPEPGASSHR